MKKFSLLKKSMMASAIAISTLAAPLSALKVQTSEKDSERVPAASVPTKMRAFLYGTLKENDVEFLIGSTTVDSLEIGGTELLDALWENASEINYTLKEVKLAINPIGDGPDAESCWQCHICYAALEAIDVPGCFQLADSAASMKRELAVNVLGHIVFTLRYNETTNKYSFGAGYPGIPDSYSRGEEH